MEKIFLLFVQLSVFLLCNQQTSSEAVTTARDTEVVVETPPASSAATVQTQTSQAAATPKAAPSPANTSGKYLYGFNTANAFDILSAGDKNSVKLVADIKPAVLRFPGGTIGNYYHVTGSDYGFRDEDVKKYGHKMMDKKIQFAQKGRNNIYEFIDFVKEAGVRDVIYVANVLTADYSETETALDLLRNAGLNVVAIELGNELYSQTFRKYVGGIDGYINTASSFAKKLKNKYPSIKLGVPVAPMHAKVSKNHQEWNSKLASLNFYDGVIFHAYPPTHEYETIADVNSQFGTVKNFLVDYLQQTLPSVVKKYNQMFPSKELWITEWNIPVSNNLPNTMLHAMFIAQFQLQLKALSNQYPNLTIANYHNLATKKDRIFSLINPSTNVNYEVFKNIASSRISEPSNVQLVRVNKNDCFLYSNTTADGKKNYVIINWSSNKVSDLLLEKITASIDEIEGSTLYTSAIPGDERFKRYGLQKGIQKKRLTNHSIEGANFSVPPYSVTFINR